jgi:hypothetical protein
VAYEFAKAGTNDLMEAEFAKRAQLRAAAAEAVAAASPAPVATPVAAAE